MTSTSYLAKFGPSAEVVAANPDLFINPNEPGPCGKIVCKDPAVVVLSDNSRSMRYCDAHAENVRRGNDYFFPIYSAPLSGAQESAISDPCANCGRDLADHDRNELAACMAEHREHLGMAK